MISFLGLAALEAFGHVGGWNEWIWLGAFILDLAAWTAVNNV